MPYNFQAMIQINFNDKKFILLENSENGKVNGDTKFHYEQEGSFVSADYYGGSIKYGKIIALLKDDELDMLYQCLTIDNELKAGKAKARVSFNDKGKMLLSLNWQWLNQETSKTGESEYIEID